MEQTLWLRFQAAPVSQRGSDHLTSPLHTHTHLPLTQFPNCQKPFLEDLKKKKKNTHPHILAGTPAFVWAPGSESLTKALAAAALPVHG